MADAQLSGWLEGPLQTMQAAVLAERQEAERARAATTARAERQAEADRSRHSSPYL